MRRSPCAVLLLAPLVLVFASSAAAGPGPGGGTISGRITLAGDGVPGVVSIRERLPLVPHFFNFPRQAAHIHRRLDELPREDVPWRRVETRADGWFRIDGVAPACYDLRVEGPDGHWGGAGVPVLVAGQHVEIDVPLETGGSAIEGHVRYADGRPFRGHVAAFQGDMPGSYWDEPHLRYERGTQTDQDGHFRIEGLATAQVTLVAQTPGLLRQHLPRRVEPGQDVVFVLDDEPKPFRGRIVDIETREPIAGVGLAWESWWDGTTSACGFATSDAAGRFVLTRPRGSKTVEEIHVHAPGYGRRRYEYPRHDGSFVAHLRRAARMEGRVLDPQGRGVAGLFVQVEHRSWRKRGSKVLWTEQMQVGLNEPVLTDAEGRFVHEDLDWGDVDLYARGHGWIPAGLVSKDPFESKRDGTDLEWRPHRLRAGETLRATLHVERGAVLRGVLRDPKGDPVAGVPVLFDSDGEDPLYEWTGYERPPLAATDVRGRFEIEGLLPGSSFELHARRRDYPKVVVEAPELTRKPQPPLELVGLGPTRHERALARSAAPDGEAEPMPAVDRGRWILLRVVAADTGEPIAGAHVHAMMNPRPGWSKGFEIEWRTDEDGRVRMGPFGEMTGSVHVGRARGYIDRNQVPFGMPTPEGKPFTVVLERAYEIRWRVVLPDGRTAAGATVVVGNVDGDIWKHYRGAERTRDDGTWVSRGHIDKSVRYELKAAYWDDERGYETTATVRGGDEHVEMRLVVIPGSEEVVRSRRERLRVRVLGPGDRALPRATIRLGDQEPSRFEDGLAHFDSAVDAQDVLRIWEAAAEDGWPLPYGPLTLDPVGSATGILVVHLPEERRIEGVLLAADGMPMRGIEVRALVAATTDALRPWAGVVHDVDRTGEDGRFRLGRLGDEVYEIRFATPPSVLPPMPHLRTKPAGEPLVVRLRVPVAIRLRIVDGKGHAIQGAVVRARIPVMEFHHRRGEEDPRRGAEGTTDAAGEVTLEALDPSARYRLEVYANVGGERRWTKRDEWVPEAGDVVLERNEK